MSRGDKQGRPYPGVSVSTKLLFYFLIFMMLLLSVLFVFQVMLLNVFYRYTKINEMEHVADMIEVSLENGNQQLSQTLIDHADEYRICIRVFAPSEDGFVEIAGVDAAESCFLHHIESNTLNELCQKALDKGGHYRTVKPLNAQNNEIVEDHMPGDLVNNG